MSNPAAQNAKPRVILGLMTFNPDPSSGARILDVGEFGKALDVFQGRGYHEVDTARVYGNGTQEAFTREAGWKKRGLKLATKVKYPHTPGDNVHDKVIESVEKSLAELGTDSVDILYLHAADRATPFTDTISALDKLHKAGKFTTLGLSNFTAFEVAEVVMTAKYNNWVRPTLYQAMYNAITRSIEPELVPALRRYGIDIVIYNPIAGGLFSGKIKSVDVVPESGRYNADDNMGKMYRKRYIKDTSFQALQLIEPVVARHGLTMIETALRWAVHHSALKVLDGNDGIIIGVSSKEQIDDNLTNLEKGPLPDEVVKVLDDAWNITKVDTAPYWHLDIKYTYDTKEALFGAGAK
ncbi:Aldo/keto reductase [Thozetella sp. PMI_491]|nr:Aldo/keto reductase [Thozetella sp. PMI_491]